MKSRTAPTGCGNRSALSRARASCAAPRATTRTTSRADRRPPRTTMRFANSAMPQRCADGRRATCRRSRLHRLPHAQAQNRRRGACGHDRSFDSAAKAGGRSFGAEGGDHRVGGRSIYRRGSPLLSGAARRYPGERPLHCGRPSSRPAESHGGFTAAGELVGAIPSRASRILCGTRARLRRGGRLGEGHPVFRGGGAPGADRVPPDPAWQRAHGKPAVPTSGSGAAARHWPGS